MNKPIRISITYTAAGLLSYMIVALIAGLMANSAEQSLNSGVAAAVFISMLCLSTDAAYKQGKKDALAGDATQQSTGEKVE